MCWKNGQRSPVHDHASSACVVRVLRGTITETRFTLAPNGAVKALGSTDVEAGCISAAQDDDLHQIANLQAGDADLVTLHIYTPPLMRMATFSLTDKARGEDVWFEERKHVTAAGPENSADSQPCSPPACTVLSTANRSAGRFAFQLPSTCFWPIPDQCFLARRRLSSARDRMLAAAFHSPATGFRFRGVHYGVKAPDLPLRFPASPSTARSAFPLHCRIRFAPIPAASSLQARCSPSELA
jgi:hypothetical protein